MPELIPVSVDTHAVISRSDRLFDQKPGTIVNEIVQNAYRVEGCTEMRIYVHPEEKAVTFANNGKLVEDFRDLFRLGGSNWDEKVVQEQDPAGMGFFSLVTCDKVQISSGDRRVEFQGRQLTDPNTRLEVTTCEYESCTRLKVWNEALYDEFTSHDQPVQEFRSYGELSNLPYFPLKLFLNDVPMNKNFFGKFRTKGIIIKEGELHPGCWIQVYAPNRNTGYSGQSMESGRFHLCWHGNVLELFTREFHKWALAEMVDENDKGRSDAFKSTARESWLWLVENITIVVYSTSNPWGAQLKLPDRQKLVQSEGTKAMVQAAFKFAWKGLEEQCNTLLEEQTLFTMSPWCINKPFAEFMKNKTVSPELWCHLANFLDKRMPVEDVRVNCYDPPEAQREDHDDLNYSESHSFSKLSMKGQVENGTMLFLRMSEVTPLAFPILNILHDDHWLVESGNRQMLKEIEFLPEEGVEVLKLETAKLHVDGHEIPVFRQPLGLVPHEDFGDTLQALFGLTGNGEYHFAGSFALTVEVLNTTTGKTRILRKEGRPGNTPLGTHVFNTTAKAGEEDEVDSCYVYVISDEKSQSLWTVDDIAELIMLTMPCMGSYKYDDDGCDIDVYDSVEQATAALVEHLSDAGYDGYDRILTNKIRDGFWDFKNGLPGDPAIHGSLIFVFNNDLLVLEMHGSGSNVRDATEAERQQYAKKKEDQT